MDYYKILEIDFDCNDETIKKNYHNLCKKYHPDKSEGNNQKFLEIQQAYEVLSNKESRRLYDFKKLFNYDDFTEDEFNLLNKYYESFINSNEFKLMKLIYKSIPDHIKISIYNRFKKYKKKEIIPLEKTIDIRELNETITINLVISKTDKINKPLKIIYVLTKNGIYYLYLREYNNIVLNNKDCYLILNFI